jgi:cytochrome c2
MSGDFDAALSQVNQGSVFWTLDKMAHFFQPPNRKHGGTPRPALSLGCLFRSPQKDRF